MNTEKQRIAIAEACGWKMSTELIEHTDDYPRTEKRTFWISPSGERGTLPDYLNDLNAMHEVQLTPAQWDCDYVHHLGMVTDPTFLPRYLIQATAAQRAEAFLRTIGKWEESK